MIGFDAIGQGSIGEISQADTLVFVPAAAVTVTATEPAIQPGISISPTVCAVAVTNVAPLVAGGKSVAPPAATVVAVANAPLISISSNNAIPVAQVTVTVLSPDILGGNYIEASNTVTMITPYGEIGSTAIGQGAIGEGDESTRIVKRGPLVLVSTAAPLVSAGKSVRSPAALVAVSTARPEIDSRGRKLRVLAIAS